MILVGAGPADAAVGADPGVTGEVTYQPPVDGTVTDPFRPPAHFAGPGNRGLEYATTPGAAVRAAAEGTVVFAGPVGGDLHVTIAHDDGLRTSYSWVASIAVHPGDRVGRGQVVGTSDGVVHFGARRGDTYIDPATLFVPLRVRLVSVGDGPSRAAHDGAPVAVRRAVLAIAEVIDAVTDRLRVWSR